MFRVRPATNGKREQTLDIQPLKAVVTKKVVVPRRTVVGWLIAAQKTSLRRAGRLVDLSTASEGAETRGVCRDTIYTASERDELHHIRIGGRRSIRQKREWIDRWFERHTRPAWGCADWVAG